MKGFIEVTYNDYNGGKKLLVNIDMIERIEKYIVKPFDSEEIFKGTKTMIMTICNNNICVKEDYEEIYQKIEEAQGE